MDVFIEFLETYWKYIAIVVVVLFDIVLLIVKGKTKTVAVSNLDNLVPLIIEAENMELTGKQKLVYVLNAYLEKFPESQVPTHYLVQEIEMILKTPTKKGGCGREQDN